MRNWLIRTTNNTILGPIPEKKLKVLIKKGSLEANDEICSGNGYWISIKEVSLVKKYLYQGVEQGFDPIYHISEQDDEILKLEKESNAQELELDLEIFSRDDNSSNDEDIESLSTTQTQDISKFSKYSQVLTGNFLKLLVGICIFTALILIYFRNSLLDSIFS